MWLGVNIAKSLSSGAGELLQSNRQQQYNQYATQIAEQNYALSRQNIGLNRDANLQKTTDILLQQDTQGAAVQGSATTELAGRGVVTGLTVDAIYNNIERMKDADKARTLTNYNSAEWQNYIAGIDAYNTYYNTVANLPQPRHSASIIASTLLNVGSTVASGKLMNTGG